MRMRCVALVAVTVNVGALVFAAPCLAAEFTFKERFLGELAGRVPGVLKTFHEDTGAFGGGIWTCMDQQPMLPLAVAYATKGPGNPYYKDAKLLAVICKAGDRLIAGMDATGQFEFVKKDDSRWGQIYMPWIYSRWIRAYGLIREDMPADTRARWVKAFTLGFTGISKTQLKTTHNIPTHQAMALYAAGKELGRPEWCSQASEFLLKVAAAQKPGGYWVEHAGPVVNYNFVYVDALGAYYAMSGDQRVLPALQRSTAYHAAFTYPDGCSVETIDERNPYHGGVSPGGPAFTFTPQGRAWVQQQWAKMGTQQLPLDHIALHLLHGQEGPLPDVTSRPSSEPFVMQEGGIDRAGVVRKGPWYICLSAYTAPISTHRWHQDRQNLVSIWHEKTGLILGGGNTKLQPLWSNFTVGDTSLLQHKPGEENPNFFPTKSGLFHVPAAAKLLVKDETGLDLTYGQQACRIRVSIKDDRTLEYRLEAAPQSQLPVVAHVTLLPHPREVLRTAGGFKGPLARKPVELSAAKVGGSLQYAGYRLSVPANATLHWPVLPHNPYRKDGRADPDEGRLGVRIPFDKEHTSYVLELTVE
jgi:hypothetical protein